jgi:hypothetical protein
LNALVARHNTAAALRFLAKRTAAWARAGKRQVVGNKRKVVDIPEIDA